MKHDSTKKQKKIFFIYLLLSGCRCFVKGSCVAIEPTSGENGSKKNNTRIQAQVNNSKKRFKNFLT
jgi:hypothetical protein